MRNLNVLVISVIILFLASCMLKKESNSESKSNTSSVFQLEGTWYKLPIDGSKRFVEVWEKSQDEKLKGSAFLLNIKADEKFNSEKLWLNLKNEGWIYTAEPSNQKKTDFTSSIINDSLLRFENLEHDFPQYIQYHFLSKTRLKVEIGNTDQTLTWEMEKQ